MPKDTSGGDAVTLAAPAGTDEANHDTTRFPVSDAGTITVPPEAVDPLTQVGGFVAIDTPATATGFVKLRHADAIGCNFRGVAYEPAEDGSVEVPVQAISELASHGFKVA